MAQLTSQQANDLASQFLALAQSIGDFRYTHWGELSTTQHQRLANRHRAVLTYGEDILALSTELVMTDVSDSLIAIKSVTGKLKSSLAALKNVQKGIDITAAIVTLGAAIIGKNPGAIGSAVEDLVKKVGA